LFIKELRVRDAVDILESYFSEAHSNIHNKVYELYSSRREVFKQLAESEPVSGDNPKLDKLCDLLDDLFSADSDSRGTTQSALVDFSQWSDFSQPLES